MEPAIVSLRRGLNDAGRAVPVTDLRIDRSQWQRKTDANSSGLQAVADLRRPSRGAALPRQSTAETNPKCARRLLLQIFGGLYELTKSGRSFCCKPFGEANGTLKIIMMYVEYRSNRCWNKIKHFIAVQQYNRADEKFRE